MKPTSLSQWEVRQTKKRIGFRLPGTSDWYYWPREACREVAPGEFEVCISSRGLGDHAAELEPVDDLTPEQRAYQAELRAKYGEEPY